MIHIKTVHIQEFRGIHSLDLDLGGKNYGICGSNGTGKSGVVDAIEFCLTGDVSRLTGQGSGGVSVKAHAPHVDQRDHPERASVTITGDIPSLGKSVEIRRSVKNVRKPVVTPDDADVLGAIEELQTHPEFVLSRREIIKYIITPPGERSKDVQTLLRLEHLEKVRKALTAFANKRGTEADQADRLRQTAETELGTSLGIPEVTDALVLEKVNEKRKLLGLAALDELAEDVSLKAGIAVEEEQKTPPLQKTVALADVRALRSAIDEAEPPELSDAREEVAAVLTRLKNDEQTFALVLRQGFMKMGLELITEDACPLCDNEWIADELRAHLRAKLKRAKDAEELLEELGSSMKIILDRLSERISSVQKTIEYCEKLNPPVKHAELTDYLTELRNAETALKRFLQEKIEIELTLESVGTLWWSPDAKRKDCIDECRVAVEALPDKSPEDEAREILIVAQERYEKNVSASKTADEQQKSSVTAKTVLGYYNNSCTKILEGIYDQVAENFAKYYCVINREDEESFRCELESAPAKLNLDVDFYGRGLFPPGAYHSEGHQDGMGLCLYLALMKHTLGKKFTLAVLDDVLMSVDAGHRREVCRLLKSEFPNTQFILTTHDRVWLQYMKTEGLIRNSQTFGGWTVDAGPRTWDDEDVWADVATELSKGDVAKAASLLRHYLEYMATVLADNFRARVEYRGDGRYDLGDLLPHVFKKWKKLLEAGEKSARSWGLDEVEEDLAAKRTHAKVLIAKTKTEEWAINPSVHFNEWANLQVHELEEVVDAFKDLLDSLRCENELCRSYLYVSPPRGHADEMRCNCAATVINLREQA
jgi:recombinational DNA repair ATPase RecF